MIRYLQAPDPDVLGLLFALVILLVALSLHEFGHAAAAHLLGDPTPKLAGRLTLNPVKHLDMVGSILILLVGFGWGKPVPFTPARLRNQRFGIAIVAVAGPITNVLLAALAIAALFQLQVTGPFVQNPLEKFLTIAVDLNVVLAVFNMLPIPPLDGSRILSVLLPPKRQHIMFFLDRWGILILFVVAFALFPLLNPVRRGLISLLIRMVRPLVT